MKDLLRRIDYILDTSASATERLHRRAHLTNYDLHRIRLLISEEATLESHYIPILQSMEERISNHIAKEARLMQIISDLTSTRDEFVKLGTNVLSAIDNYNEKHGTYIISPSLFQLARLIGNTNNEVAL
jgi:hypothetical protein